MLMIPSYVQYVIDCLEEKGFEAYIVGGCVRDILLGFTPFDFDITTSANPEQIISVFPKTVPTGIKHGTVTVIVDNQNIEVTTFRTESGYSDSRHPESVSFISSLKEDLARRDFTVNAMAYNNTVGLVDCFDGKYDLENKILRAVGNPEERFSEDALRILRLFRFAASLDFTIDKNTLDAALELSQGLKSISRERIFSELKKAVCGSNPNALSPLVNNGSLSFLGINHSADFKVIRDCIKKPELSLFGFLYLSSDNVLKTLSELKVSNKIKNYCAKLLILLNSKKATTKADVKNLLVACDVEIFRDFLLFKKTALNQDITSEKRFLDEIINNNEPYLISHLAINGNDLKALGITETKVGKTLEFLRKTVAENPLCNSNESLIRLIKKR